MAEDLVAPKARRLTGGAAAAASPTGGTAAERSAPADRLGAGERLALAGILLGFLVLTGLFNVLHPIWEAPEEPLHYLFIRHLAEHRALPEPVEYYSGRPGGEAEAHQAPLYYVVQAALVGWVNDEADGIWHRNPYVTWSDHPARWAIAIHRQEEAFPYRGYVLGVHLARLVSTLMGAGTVLIAYLFARRLTSSPAVALSAAALVAFNPGFAFGSATVNNDNGLALLSALFLLHALALARAPAPGWRDGARQGLWLGLALLTKLSAVLLIGLAAMIWGLALVRLGRRGLRPVAGGLVCCLAVTAGLTFWWPLVNREQLGTIITSSGMRATGGGPLSPAGGFSVARAGEALSSTFASYWGTFGWTHELTLPEPAYWGLAAVCALAAVGALRPGGGLAAEGRWAAERGLAGVLTAYGLGMVAVLVLRHQHLPDAGVEQGRFLYPIAAPIATGIAFGWWRLGRVGRRLMLAAPLALFGLAAAVPVTISQSAFPEPVPAWAIFDETRVERRLGLEYANGVTLLGLAGSGWAVAKGEPVQFDVYWRADEDQRAEMWADFRLVDADGVVRAVDHAIPQRYVFPPSLWQRGETILDRRALALPADAPRGPYRLEVRLLADGSAADIPLAGSPAVAGAWTPIGEARLRGEETPAPSSPVEPPAVFGGRLALDGWDPPPRSEPSADGLLCVGLHWRAVSSLESDLFLSLQLLDAGGGLAAQRDAPLHYGYRATLWEPGERVVERHCAPVDGLPAGTYPLVVVIYRPEDGARLPLAEGGETMELDRVAVGTRGRE